MVMYLPPGQPWGYKLEVFDHAFIHRAQRVEAASWQSVSISDKPEMTPHELLGVTIEHLIPDSVIDTQEIIKPNLPWAEDHFLERVSGEPLNPPPSHEWWPFNRNKSNDQFRQQELFSHTYPERFWPRMANTGGTTDKGRQIFVPHVGVRFEYGDLGDVVNHLIKDPMSRQAFLPVWFPEDTGVVHGERVPCTLGYHFIIRNGMLYCIYYIRSCDYMRHFADDVYMAMRLTQWVVAELMKVYAPHFHLRPGYLVMHITSFHVFEGDLPLLRSRNATKS